MHDPCHRLIAPVSTRADDGGTPGTRTPNLWTMSSVVVGSQSRYGATGQGAPGPATASVVAVLGCCTAGGRPLPCQATDVVAHAAAVIPFGRRSQLPIVP